MPEYIEAETRGMGTNIMQRVYGHNAGEAIAAVAEEMKRLEGIMSFFLDSSEVSSLNRAAGSHLTRLSRELIYVLIQAKQYAALSYGTFDITAAPLVKLWGVFSENEAVPEEEAILKALELIDYRDIWIDESAGAAMLRKKGQMVDLGGIAKGFAADRAIEIYREKHIESAIINLGGNVLVLGGKADGSPWRIGLQNPFSPRGEYIGVMEICDKSVVTAGDYVRFFERDGTRYHHILHPKTGYPACSGVISATVISKSSIEADALSTALLILGVERGMELIGRVESAEAIFVTENKEVYLSPGIINDFIAVEDENGFVFM